MKFSSPLNKRGVTPAKAMVAAISGYAMDGFDLLILGFMLPVLNSVDTFSGLKSGERVNDRVQTYQRDYPLSFKIAVVEQVEKGEMTDKQAQQR